MSYLIDVHATAYNNLHLPSITLTTVHFDITATYPKASKALKKIIQTGLDTDEALQSTDDDGHRHRYPPMRLLDEQDAPEPSKKNVFNGCTVRA